MKEYKKYLKYTLILLLVLTVSIVIKPFNGKNIYQLFTVKTSFKQSLSKARQDNYDKMKIDYVNIKNRITGTAPFNEGEVSNDLGIDVSDTDNYVRTFDVLKYTLELGISPNTEKDGVTDSSTFTGGVIKVRAKLPNQGDLVLMTWEKDAWMQNVAYNADKTEIYAEYHVPEGVSITNANQNLTFTVNVGGYKKEVTSEMQPEFEVWMEGNKPDDSNSKVDSVSTKDDNDKLIISGHPSFDIGIATTNRVNYRSELEGLNGQYVTFGIGISMYQDVPNFSDLRGIEYPSGNFETKLLLQYYYNNISNNNGWTLIDSNNDKATGILNGTKIIAYSLNGAKNPDYWPVFNSNTSTTYNFPYGKESLAGRFQTVKDSGEMNVTLDENILKIDFSNFKFDGSFPKCTSGTSSTSSTTCRSYPESQGYFAAGNVELFIPYYDDGNASYDYQFYVTAMESKYNTINKENLIIPSENNNIKDVIKNNNKMNWVLQNRLSGRLGQHNWYIYDSVKLTGGSDYSSPQYVLGSNYYSEDGYLTIGEYFQNEFYSTAVDGPYEGGADNLIVWDSSKTEIVPYQNGSWIIPRQSSHIGFPTSSWDGLVVKYGIYKDKNLDVSNVINMNEATYEDFDWYTDPLEAKLNGNISAVYVDDPNNSGNYVSRLFSVRMKVIDNNIKPGTTVSSIYKIRYFGDKERTKIYYYDGSTGYISKNRYKPTIYNAQGNIISAGTNHTLGETILIVKNIVSVTTPVTDKDSNDNLKSAYDVGDGEIHIGVNPTLTNGKTALDSDPRVDSVIVKSYLPQGLSYKPGSANKEPKSVIVNTDGTTTIEWEYNNWQVNHAAPDYPTITYTAEISASLENNASLEFKSTIFTKEDLRDEKQFRTSKYGVVISNLAGSQALKEVDKSVIERNESFIMTSMIGNTSQEDLKNVKVLEILPQNNDSNGSMFSGDYEIKVKELAKNQKLYYTTNTINDIGITLDKYGKLTIKDVNLASDKRWIEVQVGDIIPTNAKALATSINKVSAANQINYQLEVIPNGNKANDKYAFTMNVTSDNLVAAIKTNTVISTVVERNIEGIAFIDKNRNDIYDDKDTLINNQEVILLDSELKEIRKTTTDDKGHYVFDKVDKGNYYVSFNLTDKNYEVIKKGTNDNSSKINTDGKTDIITSQNNQADKEFVTTSNINMGIRQKEAKVIVHHYIEGTTTKLSEDVETKVYYGDKYTTLVAQDIPANYELKTKSDNYMGVVEYDLIDVIYYYQKKDSNLETNITKEATEKITKKDEAIKYVIKYDGTIKEYIGPYQITIIDELEHKIDLEKSNLDGGIYDEVNNQIVWTEEGNIDSYKEENGEYKVNITKNLEIVYSDITGTDRLIKNKVIGKIKLDNNEREVSDNSETKVEIKGKVIVHHYLKDSEEKLVPDEEYEKLVGEEVKTKEKEELLEKYNVTGRPPEENVIVKEETTEVSYYYEKKIVHVITIVDGIGGSISGDEDVYYGDSSTPNYIIIKPDKGYIVKSIKINGEEIPIPGENKGEEIILSEFNEMKEDAKVEVSFKKQEVITPPNTVDKITSYIGIGIISLITLIVLIIVILKRKKKESN